MLLLYIYRIICKLIPIVIIVKFKSLNEDGFHFLINRDFLSKSVKFQKMQYWLLFISVEFEMENTILHVFIRTLSTNMNYLYSR